MGFEPTMLYSIPVFKASAISHSAISPKMVVYLIYLYQFAAGEGEQFYDPKDH